jgi:HAD superfamily hydrolase (TIGR01509 family)
MKVTGYLLDIDGTLLDSREAHARAWQRTLAEHGIAKELSEITFDFAAPDPDVVPDIFGEEFIPQSGQIVEEKNAFFLEELAAIPLFPGVTDVIERIQEVGGRICFVSSNYDRVIEGILKSFGWDTLGAQFVGLDGVTNAKPDPEMVLKAVKKLQLQAPGCVMIGDSPPDIQAGHAAGTWTIAVCSSGNRPEDFARFRPNMVLDSVADLLPLLPLELRRKEI